MPPEIASEVRVLRTRIKAKLLFDMCSAISSFNTVDSISAGAE